MSKNCNPAVAKMKTAKVTIPSTSVRVSKDTSKKKVKKNGR